MIRGHAMKEYSDYVADLRQEAPDLADAIADWHSIESVLAWMQTRSLPPGSVDLIAQDEFEYDFLVPLDAGGRWLWFGVT